QRRITAERRIGAEGEDLVSPLDVVLAAVRGVAGCRRAGPGDGGGVVVVVHAARLGARRFGGGRSVATGSPPDAPRRFTHVRVRGCRPLPLGADTPDVGRMGRKLPTSGVSAPEVFAPNRRTAAETPKPRSRRAGQPNPRLTRGSACSRSEERRVGEEGSTAGAAALE